MMLKKKNSRWARLKYVSILPLAAVAIALFARPEVSEKFDEFSAVKVSDFTSMNEGNVETFANVQDVVKEKSKKEVVSRKDDKSEAQSADDSIRIYKDSIARNMQQNVNVDSISGKVEDVEKITFDMQGSIVSNPEEFYETTHSSTVKISQAPEIKEFLKELPNTEVGEDGNFTIYGNEIVSITVVGNNDSSNSFEAILGQQKLSANKPILITTKRGTNSLGPTFTPNTRYLRKEPLYIVDGVEISSLPLIKQEDIESISILTDTTATSIYGARASNGVVLVTTKSSKINPLIFRRSSLLKMLRPPLYIVDDVEISDISSIKSEDIEMITALKKDSAMSIYGLRAANGVFVVTTKKGKIEK